MDRSYIFNNSKSNKVIQLILLLHFITCYPHDYSNYCMVLTMDCHLRIGKEHVFTPVTILSGRLYDMLDKCCH